ncbi:SDR family oxidoreductase [Alteromonas sp. ASW11-36]|uniref:SDR family oxidoreductase n=2 Tax=Alteromonas arenosi TaxID=3055817 RepID=A0ABT7SZ33_9ALTE|nr:SDR family oxidoreductase [Alteromonas sp. ASW11-36]
MKGTKVAIIGCGWLGLPTARALLNDGYQVIGSSRSETKLDQLEQFGITPVRVDIYQPESYRNTAITECSTWLINIAAGRRNTDFPVYIQRVKALIDYATQCKVAHLIFVSTTAVYGNANGTLNETSPLQPVTASGKAHAEIESYIQAQLSNTHSILRLAGLVSLDRHPVRSLSKRAGPISGGDQVVNLIHRDDVISALEILCEIGPQSDKPLLLASPEHPTRREYYTWAATQLGIQPPEFEANKGADANSKQVDGSDSLKRIGLTLRYASPYDMLAK